MRILSIIIMIILIVVILELYADHIFNPKSKLVFSKKYLKQRKELPLVKQFSNKYVHSLFNPSIYSDKTNNKIYITYRFSYRKSLVSMLNKFSNSSLGDELYETVGLLQVRNLRTFEIEDEKVMTFPKQQKSGDNRFKTVMKGKLYYQECEDIRIMYIEDGHLYLSYSVQYKSKPMIGIGKIKLDTGNDKVINIEHINTIITRDNKIMDKPQKNWQYIPLDYNIKKFVVEHYGYNDSKILMHINSSPIWEIGLVDINKGSVEIIKEFCNDLGTYLRKQNWHKISDMGIGKVDNDLRCTTPFKVYDDNNFITLLHTYKPYKTVPCLVNRKTLLPEFINQPITWNPADIEYPSGLEIIGKDLYIGLGINDLYSKIFKLDKYNFF